MPSTGCAGLVNPEDEAKHTACIGQKEHNETQERERETTKDKTTGETEDIFSALLRRNFFRFGLSKWAIMTVVSHGRSLWCLDGLFTPPPKEREKRKTTRHIY